MISIYISFFCGFCFLLLLSKMLLVHEISFWLEFVRITGWARLIQSHSLARFSFKLSGNSNYIIHCNSNYVQNFELEINSI